MTRARPFILGFAVLALAACEPEPEPQPQPLVRGDAWERVSDAGVDFFADQRPADAVCDDAGWSVDPLDQTLEIATEVCDYPTFRQTTLEPLTPGDVVTVLGYHDELTAAEPSEGYLALMIDGELELELTVPIPSQPAEIEEELTIDRTIPAGSEVQLHVHNHGPNTWELIAVLVTPAG